MANVGWSRDCIAPVICMSIKKAGDCGTPNTQIIEEHCQWYKKMSEAFRKEYPDVWSHADQSVLQEHALSLLFVALRLCDDMPKHTNWGQSQQDDVISWSTDCFGCGKMPVDVRSQTDTHFLLPTLTPLGSTMPDNTACLKCVRIVLCSGTMAEGAWV